MCTAHEEFSLQNDPNKSNCQTVQQLHGFIIMIILRLSLSTAVGLANCQNSVLVTVAALFRFTKKGKLM